jgi:glycosyltransferase involved in cell wall biosynthesis
MRPEATARRAAAPPEVWIHALGAKAGGGLTYLYAVLPALVEALDGRGVRVVVLVPGPLDGVDLPAWVDVRPMPGVAASHPRRVLFDQIVLPLWLRRRRNAVLFCSGSHSPFYTPVPTVALVRNAIYFDEEFLGRELPKRRLLLRLQGALIARGARSCAAVHYPSDAMRSLVEARHPELGPLGAVNPYGVGEAFVRPGPGGLDRAPVARDGVTTFLYVMNYTLQKNLGFLLRALALARAEGLPVRVAVTSRLDRGPRACFDEDRAIIEQHDLVGSGYLAPVGPTYGADLVELYRSVDACVFPSFCESFGHPLVEAMAAGKPLVCADRPYARELCGDHAAYVDPDRPEELVALWRRWPEVAASLPVADPARLAATFSWRAHVARLVEALLGEPSEGGASGAAPSALAGSSAKSAV